MPKITKRFVDSLAPSEKDRFEWDSDLKGFGIRMKPTGSASYLVQYKTPTGATRRLAFAKVGVLTPDEARDRARKLLSEVADGADPSAERHAARKALTVSQLLDLYLVEANAGRVLTRAGKPKKATTLEIDKGRSERHLKPLLGHIVADSLTRKDLQTAAAKIASGATAGKFKTDKKRGLARVTGGEGSPRRTLGFLGGVFSWALDEGHLKRADNPCQGLKLRADEAKDRILSTDELARLGVVCREASDPLASAALRLIAMTGLRRGEAFNLRWSEIDERNQALRLADSKTGKSIRVIGKPALDLLRSLPHTSSPFVFPASRSDGAAALAHPVKRLLITANIIDAGPHDLRRTFASIGGDLELSDTTIAALLGHAATTVTGKHYIRRSDATLIAAADMIASAVDRAMQGCAAEIVPITAASRA